ncbi:hypothetical protein [Corynebacterium phoceense]|uniref:hypothetical protein n=1 Tax=Corynebacterium phoceense TaxID=1686286 RepID=UPI00211C38FB|nr:hypothetical protein [Corynebacterium phoceense]MCQ9332440.1 hypothetical protein [Corynebacterium phoceense]
MRGIEQMSVERGAGEMEKDYRDSYRYKRIRERWSDEALAWAEGERRRMDRGIVEFVREELGAQADGLTDDEIIEGYHAAMDAVRPIEGDREWWTAEQAADFFNVSVREIEERYRPLMPGGAVIEPEKEYEYVYDFEREGFVFDEQAARSEIHKPMRERVKEWEKYSTTPYRRGFTINPDRVGRVPQEGDSNLMGTINERGYDHGLEPVSRRLVRVTPRLYLKDALMNVRWDKVQSRRVKPLPPRGADGRFTKGG